jgi:GTP-binding protein
MFVDKVKIRFSAGRGGDGVVAWRREKYVPKGGPAGGDGGNGGSVYLEMNPEIVSLESLRNRSIISAKNGAPGGSNNKQGRTGDDIVIQLPPGTLVKNLSTGEVLFDFAQGKRKEILCRGGRGGKGNSRFRSPTHQAPYEFTTGTPGEAADVELELKLIADVGLIGIPNAGKSSLMNAVTDIEVPIGAYPFTTLHPNLSYIQFEEGERLLIADIPGIIEGAHDDRGLGLAFLRHIERTSILVFVIDVAGSEGRDPRDDFRLLQKELAAYNPDLLNKETLVALNKIDLDGANELAAEFMTAFPDVPAFPISAAQHEGLEPLIAAMRRSWQNGRQVELVSTATCTV